MKSVFTRKAITVKSTKGAEIINAFVHRESGLFAYHSELWKAGTVQPKKRLYGVTHIPTGYRIAGCYTVKTARLFILALIAAGQLDMWRETDVKRLQTNRTTKGIARSTIAAADMGDLDKLGVTAWITSNARLQWFKAFHGKSRAKKKTNGELAEGMIVLSPKGIGSIDTIGGNLVLVNLPSGHSEAFDRTQVSPW